MSGMTKASVLTIVIHLEETELTPGLRLRLNSHQAILKFELSSQPYHQKLSAATKFTTSTGEGYMP